MIALDTTSLHKTDMEQEIYTYSKNNKQIIFKFGNLASTLESYDIVAISAFKNDYIPTYGSLIGALQREKGISVLELSKNPEIDLRAMNCWLSKPVACSNLNRIACVELLGYEQVLSGKSISETIIKSTFTTFRFILEQASNHGIKVKRIALPLLGAGQQRIDAKYIVVPLVTQCFHALETIDELREIVFYEINLERLIPFVEDFKRIVEAKISSNNTVFLSYSSKQSFLAHEIHDCIENHGYSCWIAPESIPMGSNYLTEIPVALSKAQLVLLLLTHDAIMSQWVKREISSAIGAGKIVLPYQIEPVVLNPEFVFMMNGIQILRVSNNNGEPYVHLLREIERRINTQ